MSSPRFAFLVAGLTVNAVGSWAAAIAVWGYATYQFHAGPAGVAALTAAAAAPTLLFGAPVGVAVDRLTPRPRAVVAYSVSAGLASAMVLCRSLAELAGVAFLLGISSAMGRAATAALPPTVMDHDQLSRANALMGTSSSAGQVLGPLVAGATIAVFGFHAAFLVDALTYVVGVGCLAPIHAGRPTAQTPGSSWRDDLAEGLAAARSVTVVRQLLFVSGALMMTSGAFVVFEPLYTDAVLGRPPSQFALFEVSAGAGALICGFVLASIRRRWVTPGRAMAAAVANGCACALFLGTAALEPCTPERFCGAWPGRCSRSGQPPCSRRRVPSRSKGGSSALAPQSTASATTSVTCSPEASDRLSAFGAPL